MKLPALVLAALALALALALPAAAQRSRPAWVAAWTGSPQAQPPPLKPLKNQTVRQRIRLSAGGSQVRLVISNEYGTRPLVIGAASVGRSAGGAATGIVPLTFGGSRSITAAIGAPVVSDAVSFATTVGGEVEVSLYLPEETLPETWHRQITASPADLPGLVSSEGDFTAQPRLAGAAPMARLFVSRIDVLPARPTRAVVVLGTTRFVDSGWQDMLGARLGAGVSVVNASIVANPLTRPYPGGGDAALARFDRDVLMVPGISHVIIADAANDIGQAGRDGRVLPTIEALQAAYRQLAARARARSVKVVVATVLPFGNVPFEGFVSPEKERVRAGLNAWLRQTREFDGLIDMDVMLRDPAEPTRIRPGMDTANHFGPNAAGDRVLADGIDLRLFR